jgi:demethylmenaquinone methyltransferase / 2-methoxy-6-polyprenyl-1,4-benzoquinol methylase
LWPVLTKSTFNKFHNEPKQGIDNMFFIAVVVSLVAVLVYYFTKRAIPNDSGAAMGSGSMFDSIAPYYDSANKVMSLGFDQSWRQSLVDKLELVDQDVILDVSTGTGDVAILVAKKLQNLGRKDGQPVTGFDPSAKMLSFAAKKIEDGKLKDLIQLVQGDAQNMDTLKDNYYSKVAMSFGIRNVPDRMKALKEIYRVMRHNGKVIIMEFSTPSSGYLAPISKFLLQHFVPTVGGLISGGHTAEYDHLRDSILNFPSPSGFQQMMTDAGFSDCGNADLFLDSVYLYTCSKIVPEVIHSDAEYLDMTQSVM